MKITKVSCDFWINADNASLTGIQIAQASENKATFKNGQYLTPPQALLFGASTTQFQVLADTLHVIPASWRPAIQIGFDVNATSVAHCTISGSET